MNKKYELTEETLYWEGATLHRIKALRNFRNIKAGDLGGWIEKERNLSQEGDCWVGDYAMVWGNAMVYNNAIVCNNTQIWENARVWGRAEIGGNAKIYNCARIYGDTTICEDTEVFGNAQIYDTAIVYGNAKIYDDAVVFDEVIVSGNANICGSAAIYGSALVGDNAEVGGKAQICGNAEILDDAHVYGGIIEGSARVCGNALVNSSSDIIWISSFGRYANTITAFQCADGSFKVNSGLFTGKLEEYEQKIKNVFAGTPYWKEYSALMELIRSYFEARTFNSSKPLEIEPDII